MDVVRQQARRLHRGIHLQTTGTLIKADNLLLEAVGGQRLLVRMPYGALKMTMASETSTNGEKKRCLERSPSSGNAQEAGADMAAAAYSAPRHRKPGRCSSPGAREAGQEEQ
ncbi:unnamed protein product [Boreogadus saida]